MGEAARRHGIWLSIAFAFFGACRDRSMPRPSDGSLRQTGSLLVEWAGCSSVTRGPLCQLAADPAARDLTLWFEANDANAWIPSVSFQDGSRRSLEPRQIRPTEGGFQIKVTVPVGAQLLMLTARARPTDPAAWSLAVSDARAKSAVETEVETIVRRGRTGDYAAALNALTALRTSSRNETQAASDAQDPNDDAIGAIDAAMGRMSLALGQVDGAERSFGLAMSAARRAGRISDLMQDGSAAFWALVYLQRRFVDARALLSSLEEIGGSYPEGKMLLDFNAGLLAADSADMRTALLRYHAAERAARRLDVARVRDNAAADTARLLTTLGRAHEAAEIIRALPEPTEPCARATRLLNLSWALTESGARRSVPSKDPAVVAALAEAAKHALACPDPHRRRLIAINTAEYALSVGDKAALQDMLPALDPAAASGEAGPSGSPGAKDRDPLLASWTADVRGRSFLLEGKAAEALHAFNEQVELARGAGLTEETFRAEVGAGRALLASGRRKEAVARLTAAQKELERMLLGIPLAEGRGSFLDAHTDGVRYLVSALVEGGANREALQVARLARAAELIHAARLDKLSTLSPEARRHWDETMQRYQRLRGDLEKEAQNDWSLSKADLVRLRSERQARAIQARLTLDDAYRLLVAPKTDSHGAEATSDSGGPDVRRLPEPRAGEVFLMFFPGAPVARVASGNERAAPTWFAFAATGAKVRVRACAESEISTEAGARTVLAAFSNELKTASRVRIISYGRSDQIDWHALPWGPSAQPLGAAKEVEYGLDVPTQATSSATSPTTPSTKPLTTIARQALIVANPTSDLPNARAEAEAVSAELGDWQIERRFESEAKRESILTDLSRAQLFHYAGHAEVAGALGLSSALLVVGGSRIELGDLLAVPAVPAWVVLSACDAAGTVQDSASLMGIAQVFVAAGSKAALAPVRPVRDEDARFFVTSFYAEWSRNHFASPQAAFQAAIHDGLARNPGSVEQMPANGWKSFRLFVP